LSEYLGAGLVFLTELVPSNLPRFFFHRAAVFGGAQAKTLLQVVVQDCGW
jgi:hypothetical protein